MPERMRTSPSYLPVLFDELTEGVVLHAADGTIVGCNAPAERLLRTPASALVGQASIFPVMAALGDDGVPLPPTREPVWELVLGGAERATRFVRLRDGECEHRIELRAVRLGERCDDAGAPCMATILAVPAEPPAEPSDTARRRLEAVGLLATSTAHEFNNLLTVILGYSEMLQMDLGPSAAAWRAAVEVQKAALRGAGLTQHLLALGRGTHLGGEELDVDVALAELQPMLSRVLGAGRTLEVVPGAGTSRVRIERGRFEQAMVQIVENARRATAGGGKVRITSRCVELKPEFVSRHGGAHAGDHVMVEVRDDGFGMSPQALKRGFDPFFTLWGGQGIGLALVRGIARANGGCVEAESVPDHGTALRLFLPSFEPSAEHTVTSGGGAR